MALENRIRHRARAGRRNDLLLQSTEYSSLLLRELYSTVRSEHLVKSDADPDGPVLDAVLCGAALSCVVLYCVLCCGDAFRIGLRGDLGQEQEHWQLYWICVGEEPLLEAGSG